jgi:hypothetical protein
MSRLLFLLLHMRYLLTHRQQTGTARVRWSSARRLLSLLWHFSIIARTPVWAETAAYPESIAVPDGQPCMLFRAPMT